MNKKIKKQIPYIRGLLLLLATGTASWALYRLLNQGISDLLSMVGVENIYYQGLIVFASVLILLFSLGFSFKKSIDKLVN